MRRLLVKHTSEYPDIVFYLTFCILTCHRGLHMVETNFYNSMCVILYGNMQIYSTKKIHVDRGRHESSVLNKSLCIPTNWSINCLLYRKLEHVVTRRYTAQRIVP